jgi:hypothetical protein
MADFAQSIAAHTDTDLSVAAQKKVGQPIGDDMDESHKQFLSMLIGLLDKKDINVSVPSSFLNVAIYDHLPERIRSKIDLMILNMADELRKIEEFYRRKDLPNAAPQLQTMLQFFKQKKDKTEALYGDVFKF